MTPIADVGRLAQGELYFPPELNGTNRKPDALVVDDNYLGRRVASSRNVTRRLVDVQRARAEALGLFCHPFFWKLPAGAAGGPPVGPCTSWFNLLSAALLQGFLF